MGNHFSPVSYTHLTVLHDKFINVDNTYLVLGGRNIGDRFFAPANYSGPVTNDRDVLVWRTAEEGESVFPQINSYMDSLWNHTECSQLQLKPPEEGYRQQLRADVNSFERDNQEDVYKRQPSAEAPSRPVLAISITAVSSCPLRLSRCCHSHPSRSLRGSLPSSPNS